MLNIGLNLSLATFCLCPDLRLVLTLGWLLSFSKSQISHLGMWECSRNNSQDRSKFDFIELLYKKLSNGKLLGMVMMRIPSIVLGILVAYSEFFCGRLNYFKSLKQAGKAT